MAHPGVGFFYPEDRVVVVSNLYFPYPLLHKHSPQGEPVVPRVCDEHNDNQPHGETVFLFPENHCLSPRWPVGQRSLFLNLSRNLSWRLSSVGNRPFFSCRLHSYPSWPIIHRCLLMLNMIILMQVTKEHLESLRYVMVGAAPVGKALEQRWQAKAPGG